MARPDKAAAVAELAGQFNGSNGVVLTDYRGLSVRQLQDLRRALGDNADYAIVKNTLTKIAAQEAGVEGVDELLVGPTAIAFVKGDVVEAAKGLRDFARANSPLVIKGGLLEGKPLTVEEITRIADLESREVLLAKLAGALLASLQSAVYLFSAPLSQAARTVKALEDKVAAEGPQAGAQPEAGSETPPEQSADQPEGGEPDGGQTEGDQPAGGQPEGGDQQPEG